MEGTLTPTQPLTVQTTAAAAANGGRRGSTASPPSSTSLHSVRKAPAKPWKKPAAPPIPPRVYRVDPRGFRQLVQRLTGSPELAPRRLQDAAPPPPDLAPRPCPPPPQQLAPLPVQEYVDGASSLSSYSSSTEFALGFSADEAAAAMAKPPQMSSDVGYQSQVYTTGIPSPSLLSSFSKSEFALGVYAGEVTAAMAEPHQMSTDLGYQSQVCTTGIPSPSLYSACLTWCNLPLLSPGSMAYLEQSSVL